MNQKLMFMSIASNQNYNSGLKNPKWTNFLCPSLLLFMQNFIHVPITNNLIIFKGVVSKTLNKEKVMVTSNAHV
jgi:hypothetical protein